MHEREYGALATIGIAVPQANPIVEPEMHALMPDGVNVLTARLQGSRTDSKDRLVGYLRTLETTLGSFDTAELDAVGYACTGSSYIVGAAEDAQTMQRMQQVFGYPVISAAAAIKSALQSLGVMRIGVFAPYPHWLADLSIDYWKAEGFDVVAHAAAPVDPSDTRSVYRIRSQSVLDNVRQLPLDRAEALILTGTGMPTIRAIGEVAHALGKPVLSSNLCLAWALQHAAGIAHAMPPPTTLEPLYGGWAGRLRA
jgi:maleate isomerase